MIDDESNQNSIILELKKSLEEKEGIATFEEKQGLMFKQSSEKVDTNDKKSVII